MYAPFCLPEVGSTLKEGLSRLFPAAWLSQDFSPSSILAPTKCPRWLGHPGTPRAEQQRLLRRFARPRWVWSPITCRCWASKRPALPIQPGWPRATIAAGPRAAQVQASGGHSRLPPLGRASSRRPQAQPPSPAVSCENKRSRSTGQGDAAGSSGKAPAPTGRQSKATAKGERCLCGQLGLSSRRAPGPVEAGIGRCSPARPVPAAASRVSLAERRIKFKWASSCGPQLRTNPSKRPKREKVVHGEGVGSRMEKKKGISPCQQASSGASHRSDSHRRSCFWDENTEM